MPLTLCRLHKTRKTKLEKTMKTSSASTNNQSSLTRAALSRCGRPKTSFPSILNSMFPRLGLHIPFTPSIVLAGLLALSRSAVGATPVLGPVVYPANGHDYYLLTVDSWSASELEAVALGGHLVTVNNQAENDWVFATFGQDRNLWIGLHDANLNGQFTWASGEISSYSNWSPGEPNNLGVEPAVHMWGNLADIAAAPTMRLPGTWNNLDNSPPERPGIHAFGVVEVIPEPPASSLLIIGGGLMIALRRVSRPSVV
jgi:hypothetical protein